MAYFDFYNENEKDFFNKFERESIRIVGNYYDKTPLVTILIPTNNRPDLLKEAIDSALNQKSFIDYQIIIADNEGEDVNIETQTSMLVRSYKTSKIIYFRHPQSVSYIMDNAVRLCRSKYMVFLHDDDVLDSSHLKVMLSVASLFPRANYISCPGIDFVDGKKSKREDIKEIYNYRIKKTCKAANCLGYYPGWLGALINREAYISIGGMPTYSNNLGDFCMVQKFHYRIGVYEMISDTPLYYRRLWAGQASASGNEVWTDLYKNEYEYFQYVNKKIHPYTYKYWDRISAYRILEKARDMNMGVYRYNIDLKELVDKSKMSDNSLLRADEYKTDLSKKTFYEAVIEKWFTRIYRGRVCL